MGKSKRKTWIVLKLLEIYPDAKADLNFSTPFELLVATLLSAQTTDIQVNKATEKLFKVANTPESLGALSASEIEEYIKMLGLYRNKSKNLKELSLKIVRDYNGEVPKDIKDLMTFPGVGKKTANVVVSNAFGIPAIAVDTHVFRVSNRLGLVSEKSVEKTEAALERVVERENWSKIHHCLIQHGRRVCKAQKPKCIECLLNINCMYFKKKNK